MKLIDEVDVKMALEKGTSDLKIIHKRILDLYDELIEVDSVIRSVAMKSPKYGNIGGGVGGIKKDLADIMLRHEQTARARGIEHGQADPVLLGPVPHLLHPDPLRRGARHRAGQTRR